MLVDYICIHINQYRNIMKKNFFLFFVFFFALNVFSYPKMSEKERFINQLKSDFSEIQKSLPISQKQGAWFWSISVENNTIVYVFKYSYDFRKQFGSEEQEIASYENLVKNMSPTLLQDYSIDEQKKIVKYGVSFKIKFYSFESNKLIFEKSISSSQLSRMINVEFSGNRPLSFYKDAFEADKVYLPKKIISDDIIYQDVNMVDNKVIGDFYINEEKLKSINYDEFNEFKRAMIDILKQTTSPESKQDFIIYKIQFIYRFYLMGNKKKLIKEIIIDPSKDF